MDSIVRRKPFSYVTRSIGAVVLMIVLPLTACEQGGQPGDGTSAPPSETGSPSASSDASDTDPVGKWSSPEAGEPFLELTADGAVSGTDGCNRIETSWELDDDTVTLAPFTSTQKACAGVDSWLAKASTATIDGDVMTVMDAQGSVIGGLEKEK